MVCEMIYFESSKYLSNIFSNKYKQLDFMNNLYIYYYAKEFVLQNCDNFAKFNRLERFFQFVIRYFNRMTQSIVVSSFIFIRKLHDSRQQFVLYLHPSAMIISIFYFHNKNLLTALSLFFFKVSAHNLNEKGCIA